MLAENPKIIDLDVELIRNFLSLFKIKKGKPSILILYENEKILKVIHTEKGVLNIEEKFEGEKTLKKFYTPELQNVLSIDRKFLKESTSLFAKKVNYEEDFLKQIFAGWEIIKNEFSRRIFIYPKTVYKFKFINYSIVKKILNLLFPKDGVFIFILFKENEIFTSLILGIKNREIDLITTTENLEEKIKDIEGIRDYKKIVEVAKQEYRLPVWGIFKKFYSKKTIIYPFNLKLKILSKFFLKI
jgi:hypothetical protein